MYVQEAGQGQPVVLLHGLASSWRYWQPHIERLGQRYRLLMPDLLGFGRSPGSPGQNYTAEEHLAALMDTLPQRAGGPFLLVGHSMGAMLALHLAAKHPDLVRGVLMVALPSLGSCMWGHEPETLHGRMHQFAVHDPWGSRAFAMAMRAAYPFWYVAGPRIRPWVPKGASQDALRGSWFSYWYSLEHVVYGSDSITVFESLRVPAVLMHGRRDLVVPVAGVRELVAHRPDIPYIELEDAGHNPPFSHITQFYEALMALEQQVEAAAAVPPPAVGGVTQPNWTGGRLRQTDMGELRYAGD